MGTKNDPSHPHVPRDPGVFVQAYRDLGDEAPWLLAWKDGHVMINPETGRYVYVSELGPTTADGAGRGTDRRAPE